MKTERLLAKPGDVYLLFNHLPYDYKVELPILLGPSVCLDNAPLQQLSLAGLGIADFLLPGYNVPGTTLNHCCLRCFSDSAHEMPSPKNLMFLALLGLRLHLPLYIDIRGQFRLGEGENPIQEPTLHLLSSPWYLEGSKVYSITDLELAAAIKDRLIAIQQKKFNRLITSLVYFGQVTLGLSQSFQLSYLGLFAALEALFVPVNKKYITLASRTFNFLKCFDFPVSIDEWLKDHYLERSNFIHGKHDATLASNLNVERRISFGRLHEITRLALLGFLSMDDESLFEMDNLSGQRLQDYLDKLNPATGDYIEGQNCWAT